VLLGGEGEGREQGVGSRSSTGDSHHDYQKRDLQVSKRGCLLRKETGSRQKMGAKRGGLASRAIFMKCCMYMYHSTCTLTSNECCV
jgi:hypothetical protein